VGIYQCSFNAGAFTTTGCYSTTAFTSTNDFLDWGAPAPNGFGAATSLATHDITSSPWTTSSNNGAVTVGVSQNSNPSPGTVERVDNFTVIPDGAGGWTNSGFPVSSYDGRFNSLTNPLPPPVNSTQYNSALTPYYGDHLIGYQSSIGNSILLTFSQPVYAVGFRISSRSNTQTTLQSPGNLVQDVRVAAYNTMSPGLATAPYLSYELQDPTGFGTCSTSTPGRLQPNPIPCNDAPYIGIDSSSALFTSAPLQSLPSSPWISSVVISSADLNGFFIDELFIQDVDPNGGTGLPGDGGGAPEPATTVLMAGGLGVTAFLSRKRRSA
jgi:hypothetical protein